MPARENDQQPSDADDPGDHGFSIAGPAVSPRRLEMGGLVLANHTTESQRQCTTDDDQQLEHVSILAGAGARINSDEFWRGHHPSGAEFSCVLLNYLDRELHQARRWLSSRSLARFRCSLITTRSFYFVEGRLVQRCGSRVPLTLW